MNRRIDFLADSLKFLTRNNLKEDFVVAKIKLTLRKFKGENVNIKYKYQETYFKCH